MRRAIAFTFDSTWIGLVAASIWYTARATLGLDLPIDAFMLVGMACAYAVLEWFYGGQTPGRFLLRIYVKSKTLGDASITQLLGRAALLFSAVPVLAAVFDAVFYALYGSQGLYSLAYYPSVAVALLVVVPMLFTAGQQGFHDWITGTVVVSSQTDVGNEASIEAVVAAIVVVGAVALGYRAAMHATVGKLTREEGNAFIEEAMGLESFDDQWEQMPTADEVNARVKKPAEYYVSHGWRGFKDVSAVDTRPSAEIWASGLQLAHYRIRVTWQGWMNRGYQEVVVENLARLVDDRYEGRGVLVEFVWLESLLDRAMVDVRQDVVAVVAHMGDGQEGVVVLSTVPKGGTRMTLHGIVGQGTAPEWIGEPVKGPGFY